MPLHLPGVTPDSLKTFLRRLRKEQSRAPGEASLSQFYDQAARALGYPSWSKAQEHLEEDASLDRRPSSGPDSIFRHGRALDLIEMMATILGRDDFYRAMWQGRAMSLATGLVVALVHLRDHAGLALSSETLLACMSMEGTEQLAAHPDLPAQMSQPLKAYLRSLPGYQEISHQQSDTVMDHHGYLVMMLIRAVNDMTSILGTWHDDQRRQEFFSRHPDLLGQVMGRMVSEASISSTVQATSIRP